LIVVVPLTVRYSAATAPMSIVDADAMLDAAVSDEIEDADVAAELADVAAAVADVAAALADVEAALADADALVA
jgi:hypothetical protein